MLLFFGSILLSCWPWMPLKTSSKLTPLKILCPGHVWFSIAYVSLSFNSGMYIFIVPGTIQASGKPIFPGYMLDHFLIYHVIDIETQKLFKFRVPQFLYELPHFLYEVFVSLRWKYIYLIW